MGKLDGSNKLHEDEYHKKRENINMHGRSIDNLKTTCINSSISNLNCAINMECSLTYTYFQLSETLFWEYYQRATPFYKIDTSISSEVTFDPITRKVSKIFDQSLSQYDAQQNTA